MGSVKSIALSLGGLLVALIVLMFVLRLLGKVPVIGAFAQDAQELATSGSLS